MRFLSDIFNLFDGMKKYVHAGHKLTFYLALTAKLPVQVLDDLNNAVRVWEARNRVGRDDSVQPVGVARGPLAEELS